MFSKKVNNVNSLLFTELDQLTGVAAILRFPMPELEDSDEDGDDANSDSD